MYAENRCPHNGILYLTFGQGATIIGRTENDKNGDFCLSQEIAEGIAAK